MHIEQLREFCLSLPGTTEDIKWGKDLCFCVGAKMYCVTGVDGGGVSLKVTDDVFAACVERDGIVPAPYLARYKWIYIENYDVFPDDEWECLIRSSYDMIRAKLPKNRR